MNQPRFNFVGTLVFPKAESKRPFYKKFTNKNKKESISMNIGVKQNDFNTAYMELFDSETDMISSFAREDDKIEKTEISWDARFDEDIVKTIVSNRLYTVDFGDGFERQTFITAYDTMNYIKDNVEAVKNRKFCVTGQMKKQWYKDRYYDKFIPQNFYVVDDSIDSRLTVIMDVYYNKESVDKTDWKSERVLHLDAYVPMYINKDEGVKLVPQQLVFNASKIDEKNERHMQLLKYRLKYIDVSSKKFQHLEWKCKYLNGTQEVEFDESQLTSEQKEQIELGIATLNDFKPRGTILGQRIVQYTLTDPVLKGDFASGLQTLEETEKEFEEMIFHPMQEEKLEEVIKEKEDSIKDVLDELTNNKEAEDLF